MIKECGIVGGFAVEFGRGVELRFPKRVHRRNLDRRRSLDRGGLDRRRSRGRRRRRGSTRTSIGFELCNASLEALVFVLEGLEGFGHSGIIGEAR